MRDKPGLEEILKELDRCQNEDEVISWVAKFGGQGRPENYAAIRKKFSALRTRQSESD
jgi:hypothetical protein